MIVFGLLARKKMWTKVACSRKGEICQARHDRCLFSENDDGAFKSRLGHTLNLCFCPRTVD